MKIVILPSGDDSFKFVSRMAVAGHYRGDRLRVHYWLPSLHAL